VRAFSSSRVAALLVVALGAPLLAQAPKEYQPPSGPTPRTAKGKVDLSGVWQKPYVPDMTKDGKNQKGFPDLPFTPWGEHEWKTYDAAEGDYTGACLPFGMTRSMNTPEPMQFMQSDTYLAFLFEQNSWFTVVPIDGRKHGDGIPTWFGDSVGHWEGDTLVVDTTHFVDKTNYEWASIWTRPTETLHLVERFRRTDEDTLEYTITIEDPQTFVKPWTAVIPISRIPDGAQIYEYACHEGNYAMPNLLSGARAEAAKKTTGR
jgi:hypothetical protein